LVFLTDLASKVGEDAKDLKVCPKDGCVGKNSESITRFSSKVAGFFRLILGGSKKNTLGVKYSDQPIKMTGNNIT